MRDGGIRRLLTRGAWCDAVQASAPGKYQGRRLPRGMEYTQPRALEAVRAVPKKTGLSFFEKETAMGSSGALSIFKEFPVRRSAAAILRMRRIGRDPAQSAKIILTTVTDVMGFMAFLRRA